MSQKLLSLLKFLHSNHRIQIIDWCSAARECIEIKHTKLIAEKCEMLASRKFFSDPSTHVISQINDRKDGCCSENYCSCNPNMPFFSAFFSVFEPKRFKWFQRNMLHQKPDLHTKLNVFIICCI